METTIFEVGNRIRFSYNGKERVGEVVEFIPRPTSRKAQPSIKMECEGGIFKTFNIDKIEGEIESV